MRRRQAIPGHADAEVGQVDGGDLAAAGAVVLARGH
jgi:hypothetical protein